MDFYVYVLRSLTTRRFYVGQTNDLANRLRRHNEGRVKSTRAFRPWSIVYVEKFETRLEAVGRERELKSLRATERFLGLIGIS